MSAPDRASRREWPAWCHSVYRRRYAACLWIVAGGAVVLGVPALVTWLLPPGGYATIAFFLAGTLFLAAVAFALAEVVLRRIARSDVAEHELTSYAFSATLTPLAIAVVVIWLRDHPTPRFVAITLLVAVAFGVLAVRGVMEPRARRAPGVERYNVLLSRFGLRLPTEGRRRRQLRLQERGRQRRQRRAATARASWSSATSR